MVDRNDYMDPDGTRWRITSTTVNLDREIILAAPSLDIASIV